jgi:hypothetical protein
VSTSPATIPYADLPERWGISLHRDEDSLRIIVPPVASWKHLPRGLQVAIIFIAVILTFYVCMMIGAIRAKSPIWLEILPGVCMYAVALACCVGFAMEKMASRLVFEVTPSQLSISHVIRGKIFHARSWPRAWIGEVKANRNNGKLLVWITGKDMAEIRVSPLFPVTEWIASEVNIALRTLPLMAIEHQHAHTDQLPLPMRNGTAKTVLLAIACVLGLFGIIMIFVSWPFSLFIFLAAAMPAGIAMGMQDKQYYFF